MAVRVEFYGEKALFLGSQIHYSEYAASATRHHEHTSILIPVPPKRNRGDLV
jgi:hypothetical protein